VRKKTPRKARKSSLPRKSRIHKRPKLKRASKSTKKPQPRKKVPAARPKVRKKVSREESRRRQKLALAKRGEALAGDQRRFVRETFKNKAPAKTRRAQSQELAGMLERARFAGKELGLSKDDIRGYRYDDGRSIVRMRVPLPVGVGAKERVFDLQDLLNARGKDKVDLDKEARLLSMDSGLSIGQTLAWIQGKELPEWHRVLLEAAERHHVARFLPEGVFLEANFLMDSSNLMRKGFAPRYDTTAFPRFKGMSRLQFWGSKNLPNVGRSMLDSLDALHKYGYRQPEVIYVRLGRTSEEIVKRFHEVPKSERKRKRLIDPEQPFTRFAPPAEGTLVRKHRPKLPFQKKPRKKAKR
jgi:hypothetical protein